MLPRSEWKSVKRGARSALTTKKAGDSSCPFRSQLDLTLISLLPVLPADRRNSAPSVLQNVCRISSLPGTSESKCRSGDRESSLPCRQPNTRLNSRDVPDGPANLTVKSEDQRRSSRGSPSVHWPFGPSGYRQ